MLYYGQQLVTSLAIDDTKLPLTGGTISGQLIVNGGMPDMTPSLFLNSFAKLGSIETTGRTGIEIYRLCNEADSKLNIATLYVDQDGSTTVTHRKQIEDDINYTVDDAFLKLKPEGLFISLLDSNGQYKEEELTTKEYVASRSYVTETELNTQLGNIKTILETI